MDKTTRNYEVCKVSLKDGTNHYLITTMQNMSFNRNEISIDEDAERGIKWIFPSESVLSFEWISKQVKGIIN